MKLILTRCYDDNYIEKEMNIVYRSTLYWTWPNRIEANREFGMVRNHIKSITDGSMNLVKDLLKNSNDSSTSAVS